MEAPITLPSSSSVSRRLLGFLDEHFKAREDLYKVPSLVAQLSRDCGVMEKSLLDLKKKLDLAIAAWISRSDEFGRILHQLNPKMEDSSPCPSREGDEEMPLVGVRRILGVELPLLAKEVGRIETIRLYAETTLKLEALVGDLEDAAFSILSQTARNNLPICLSKASSPAVRDTGWKQEKLLVAVKAMKDIEEVLVSIANSRPRWTHLVMAVDSRVEKTLAMLRPQALTDHRAVLASLGWPPSLSTSNLEKEKYLEIPNPLVLMQGDRKDKYSQSFLALCALQHLQAQREVRQHDFLKYQKGFRLLDSIDSDNLPCFDNCLWTIDELVHPIASRMEHHFSRWSEQPKFIFALAYKITRDFLEGVDHVLQPLIDKAKLVGYSAKEAWVSAMVKMLSEYLKRGIFPVLARIYGGEYGNSEVISSWLHLIDLIITFDKRMQALASSGTPLMGTFVEFEGFSRSLSLLSLFYDHPNWLQIWAEIELKDAEDKLKSELENERTWSINIQPKAELVSEEDDDSFLFCTREDYKAPLIADFVVRTAWAMIERSRALPNTSMRIRFIRSSAIIFLKRFFVSLLQRCQEMESTSAIVEDDALLRVTGSVNAAQYCESVMREWSEGVMFLEMNVTEDDVKGTKKDDQHPHSCFFGDEIQTLVKLETDCLVEIMSALLLQFDALCWDYVQNLEQWDKELVECRDGVMDEANVSVSSEFVEALDMLKDRLRILKLSLNSKDFLDLWRSIADGLDRFIFSSIPLSDVKFSGQGVHQFRADMNALFLVFRPFCARPEAFFPCISDSLKLLAMHQKDVDQLLGVMLKGERLEECLQLRGLFHISAGQAENILRNTKFGG